MKQLITACLFSLAMLVGGCQTQNSDQAASDASQALTSYLEALVAKDEVKLTLLSCADWESSALMEMDAFQSVETSLDNVDCQLHEMDGEIASVICTGRILASYGEETQEYDLSERTYLMTKQGNEWLVCGY